MAASLIALTMASSALAQTIRMPGDFSGTELERNDDGSSGPVDLGFAVDFYGLEFSQTYVNNNGNITFDAPLSSFTPFDLTATGRQIIAPYFADVDTRLSISGITTYGDATIDGQAAFIVNWPRVSYFGASDDKFNDFQLVIIDRSDIAAGDFDFEFNYAMIQWETGTLSNGVGGLGGDSARAGFSNGTGDTGTSFEIPGSAVNGAFLDSNLTAGLIHTSNVGIPGRWRFEVRGGVIVLPPEIPVDFLSRAITFNQRQVAGALDTFDFGDDNAGILAALTGLSDSQLLQALDFATGEIHASGQHAVAQSVGLFTRTLGQRARMGLATAGGGLPVLGYSSADAPKSLPAGIMAADTPNLPIDSYAGAGASSGAWIAPLGGGAAIGEDGNAAALRQWTGGIAGGYEWSGTQDSGAWTAGLALGYLHTRSSIPDRRQRMNANGINLGAYGAWTSGPWSLSGAGSFAANRISTKRDIAFGGISQTASADYWAHSFGIYGEGAYAVDVGNGVTLSPIVTLDASVSNHRAAMETGAGGLNLNIDSASYRRFDTGLGVAVATDVPMADGGLLTLDARVLWEHAFADVVPSRSLWFDSSPTTFTVLGATAGRNRLRVGLGAEYKGAGNLSVSARYDGFFAGDGEYAHSAFAALKMRF